MIIIKDSDITGNQIGAEIDQGIGCQIQNSKVYGNVVGIQSEGAVVSTGSKYYSNSQKAVWMKHRYYDILNLNPNTYQFINNSEMPTIPGAPTPFTYGGATHTVKSDGTGTHTTLESAISGCSNGDTIQLMNNDAGHTGWISNKSYKLIGNGFTVTTLSPSGGTVTLENVTINSLRLSANIRAFNCSLALSMAWAAGTIYAKDSTITALGNTITNGLTFENCTINPNSLNYNWSSNINVTFNTCIFITGFSLGGNQRHKTYIKDCTFPENLTFNNVADSFAYVQSSKIGGLISNVGLGSLSIATIQDNPKPDLSSTGDEITNNTGLGIHSQRAKIEIENATITGNTQHGLYIQSDETELINNTIKSNGNGDTFNDIRIDGPFTYDILGGDIECGDIRLVNGAKLRDIQAKGNITANVVADGTSTIQSDLGRRIRIAGDISSASGLLGQGSLNIGAKWSYDSYYIVSAVPFTTGQALLKVTVAEVYGGDLDNVAFYNPASQQILSHTIIESQPDFNEYMIETGSTVPLNIYMYYNSGRKLIY